MGETMRYIVLKHALGLAIITWELDQDYESYEPHGPDDYGMYYMVRIDVYDAQGVLVFEDGMGGVDIASQAETKAFELEMMAVSEWYFHGVEMAQ